MGAEDWGAARDRSPWPLVLWRRWKVQAYLDFMWMTRDFKFFLINVVSDVILNMAGVMAVFLLAARFDGIGPWERPQILFMLGYAAVVGGLLEMTFSYNVLHISRRVGRGQLDHLLVQPQPLWMALLTEGFMPFSGCWALLAGGGLLAWALVGLGVPTAVGWWLAFGLHVASSGAVVLAFSFMWSSMAFWSPVGAEEISSRTNTLVSQLKTFPLDGLGPVLVGTLLSALPVGLVAWYPCRVLLGLDPDPWALWHTPLMAAGLSLVALFFFKRGLKHYERTGSQRYLRWGHRG